MLIDGKKVAQEQLHKMKEEIALIKGRKPTLAVILVGNHPPSEMYVASKIKACEQIGMLSQKRTFPEDCTEENLLTAINELNQDPEVDGILVQLPLPKQCDPTKVTNAISPEKDVDGLHPTNVGKLLLGSRDGFIPCTPLGILHLMEHYEIDVTGKRALVIGRSTIVGKPMAALLMQSTPTGNATVTVAHRHTKELKTLCRESDLIVSAMGNPHFLKADHIKEGAVIFDVGINRIEDSSKTKGYSIVGDVDFAEVEKKCSHITPVPGGVGPMTIAMLLYNTLTSYHRRS